MITKAVQDARQEFELEHRNVSAEKLELEVRLRKQMHELVNPIVELQTKHKQQFVHNINSLNDHEERLAFIEYTIFKSEDRQDRFDEVYDKIAAMEKQRASDLEALTSRFTEL